MKFEIKGQHIALTEREPLVSGTANVYTAEFTFDAAWDGYVPVAVFECSGPGGKVSREMTITGGKCTVPWEVLLPDCYLRTGVYGVNGDKRLPTVYAGRQFVFRGAEGAEESAEYTPGVVDQILSRLAAAAPAPDYAQNDPAGPGYIANRPCYFTGNLLEEEFLTGELAHSGDEGAPDTLFACGGTCSNGLLAAGEVYRLTVRDTSLDLTAFAEDVDGQPVTGIGDGYGEGQETFTPTYGFRLITANDGGDDQFALQPTDGTGAMLAAAFGLTSEDLAADAVPFTVTHLVPEAVKLDRRLLPDGIGGEEYTDTIGLKRVTGLSFAGWDNGSWQVCLEGVDAPMVYGVSLDGSGAPTKITYPDGTECPVYWTE